MTAFYEGEGFLHGIMLAIEQAEAQVGMQLLQPAAPVVPEGGDDGALDAAELGDIGVEEVEGLVQILAGGQGAFQLDVDHVHMVGQLQQFVQGGDGSAGEFRVEFHAEIEGF